MGNAGDEKAKVDARLNLRIESKSTYLREAEKWKNKLMKIEEPYDSVSAQEI